MKIGMNDRVRIAVFVSGGGSNLQAILDAEAVGKLRSGRVALVISSSRSAYALQRAANAGIPAFAFSKKELGGQEAFEEAVREKLEEYGIGLIVLAGFLSILSPAFTERYDHRIINIHPALIPSFCGEGFYGLKVHEAALKKGVRITGATVHYVNAIPDGGEILEQKAVRVRKDDTAKSLQLRVMQQAEWIILPRTVEKVSVELLKREKQNRHTGKKH